MFIFCLHICFFELQYQDPVSSCKALCKRQHAKRSLLFHACKLLPLRPCIRYISAEEQKHSTDAFKTFVSPANARRRKKRGPGNAKLWQSDKFAHVKMAPAPFCHVHASAEQIRKVLRGVSCKRRGWKERKTATSWRDETRQRPLSRGAIPRVCGGAHTTQRERSIPRAVGLLPSCILTAWTIF